jgi:hypothetical protein
VKAPSIVRELRPNAGAQAEFLNATDRYPALIGGQGCGKTWAGSARLVFEHLGTPGVKSLAIAPTYPNVRQIMLPAIEERLTELGVPYKVNRTAMEVFTPTTGAPILLHSAMSAERITGFEVGRTWIDEPARIPEFTDAKRNVWMAAVGRTRHPAMPMQDRRIFITGTHEGKGTWVFRKWEEKPKPGYVVFRAKTGDNPDAAEQEALYLDEYGPELAAQYVYGFAVEDSMAAVSYDVIAGLQDPSCQIGDLSTVKGQNLYVGVDIGRSKSLTVFWILSMGTDDRRTLRTVGVIVLKSTKFADQFNVLRTLVQLPGFQQLAIDATYNPQTTEDAVEAFGASQIEPVVFTPDSKRGLFQGWVKACQDGRLRIPEDQSIVLDFFSVKRIVSSRGVVEYRAPFTADGHADRATAAALAVWAARAGAVDVTYTQGPTHRSRALSRM